MHCIFCQRPTIQQSALLGVFLVNSVAGCGQSTSTSTSAPSSGAGANADVETSTQALSSACPPAKKPNVLLILADDMGYSIWALSVARSRRPTWTRWWARDAC